MVLSTKTVTWQFESKHMVGNLHSPWTNPFCVGLSEVFFTCFLNSHLMLRIRGVSVRFHPVDPKSPWGSRLRSSVLVFIIRCHLLTPETRHKTLGYSCRQEWKRTCDKCHLHKPLGEDEIRGWKVHTSCSDMLQLMQGKKPLSTLTNNRAAGAKGADTRLFSRDCEVS